MQDFIRYLPHTEEDIRKMLDAIGVKKLEDLFQTIPKEVRLSKQLKLPEPPKSGAEELKKLLIIIQKGEENEV